MKLNVVVYCHKIFPVIFISLTVLLYMILGFRLFASEGKGKVHSLTMAFIFTSTFLLISHVGAYSDSSIECGLYIAPWQGRNVAGVLVTPLIILGLLHFKWFRKNDSSGFPGVILLIISVLLNFVTNTIDSFGELKHISMENVRSYIGSGWMFGGAAFALVILAVCDIKRGVVLISMVLITFILLVPAPLGLILAYVVTYFADWIYDKKVQSVIVWVGMLMAIAFTGFSSKSRVTWQVDFMPVENDYRISGYYIDACNKINEMVEKNGEDGAQVGALGERYSGLVTASLVLEDTGFDVLKLGDNDEWEVNIGEIIYDASEKCDYIIVHKSFDIDSSLLGMYGYKEAENIGELKIYEKGHEK